MPPGSTLPSTELTLFILAKTKLSFLIEAIPNESVPVSLRLEIQIARRRRCGERIYNIGLNQDILEVRGSCVIRIQTNHLDLYEFRILPPLIIKALYCQLHPFPLHIFEVVIWSRNRSKSTMFWPPSAGLLNRVLENQGSVHGGFIAIYYAFDEAALKSKSDFVSHAIIGWDVQSRICLVS